MSEYDNEDEFYEEEPTIREFLIEIVEKLGSLVSITSEINSKPKLNGFPNHGE